MSTFISSAPIITPEDEQAERDALSEEERGRLHQQIYGGEPEVKETGEMVQNGLVMLQEALERIPDLQKLAYLEVLERAPLLVERESDPVAFLRCETYDAWAAARHLVAYWDTRKKIFGPTRAFVAMTQRGAMAEDMEYLHKGLLLMLPDDRHERSVIGLDRVRCTGAFAPRASVVRCAFYMMQVLSERKSAQKVGYVMVTNFRGYDLYKHFDIILTKKLILTKNSFPSDMKASHILTGDSGRAVSDVVLPMLKFIAGRKTRLRSNIHVGSDTDVLACLKDFGLGEEHVRPLVGESPKLSGNHRSWLAKRDEFESRREASSYSETLGGDV